MTTGERIRKLRKEYGITADELGAEIGVARSTIYRYENGDIEKLPVSVLEPLATSLHTSVSYLMGWTEDSTDYEDGDLIASIPQNLLYEFNGNVKKAYEAWVSRTSPDGDKPINTIKCEEPNAVFLDDKKIYMLPIYESVSAGFGAQAQDNILDYLPCYITNQSEAEESLCIKVKGDSMYPKIEDGDIIQVHKQTSVDSGSIAVLLIDGEEGVVKRVVYGDDWIELHSINPMYPVLRYEGADVLRLQVVGLVKKIIKDV